MATDPTVSKISSRVETEIADGNNIAKDRESEGAPVDSAGDPAEVPTPATEAEIREISEDELKRIVEGHAEWLDADEKGDKRAVVHGAKMPSAYLPGARLGKASFIGTDFGVEAYLGGAGLQGAELQRTSFQHGDFHDANLKHAHLCNADLRWTSLQRADLEQADLTDANLEGADLRGAKLLGADLLRTKLRDANLADADLSTAKGLLAEQLAGANLSGAKLPEAVAKFDALNHVAERSQLAKRLFTALLLGCIYALLTVATTTDVRLLTNSASSPLPVIQTEVPIAGFYFAAPVILVALYLYFLLYLQRLWESLAKLPAVFPDGTPLDEKAYPWLMNGLVRSHFKLLRERPPPLSGLQAFLAIVLAYWVVPITLVFIWGRYLPRYEWSGTLFHVFLLVVAFVSAILLYKLAKKTLRAESHKTFPWRRAYQDRRAYGIPALVLLWSSAWGVVSYGAIEGHLRVYFDSDIEQMSHVSPTVWVPRGFQIFQYRLYLDLSEADVSTKPPNWTGNHKEEEVAGVKGVRLRGANLRYAYAPRAFFGKAILIEANLQGANLQGAILYYADLQGARLAGASLQDAILVQANLRGAFLSGADLQGADLSGANLQGADLRSADLQGADLQGADLREANLQGAKLWRADLQGADFRSLFGSITRGLEPEQVTAAKNWRFAYYNEDFLPKLGLPPDHNETLPGKLEERKLEELRKQAEEEGAKSGNN